jgi:hypothetical protein
MRKYLMASAMIMALAAPAVAQTAPAGGVAGTTSANPLAEARSFNEDTGASIFGGWSQGEFGSMVPDVVNPHVSAFGEPAGPFGQVIIKNEGWTIHSK